ncbi:TIR domain-containing protein [Glacieibacterium megasporae]|uniref:TIR domain-containing protein n=1 Tax=Glacieibacterium megasporae TaxID=2835787 RepID=UPI001C1E6EAF|nr:nucleotide-binding protein [Polymorphobacter megasporae]UAJ10670.1 nucleotide-binding protein [Polymorphobacter megasporae]
MSNDLFAQINNAVLDLQGSDYQSYLRPLRQLGRLLAHDDLRVANEALTAGVDLEAFLHSSEATQGGMVGSAELLWPEDPREDLALRFLLVRKAGDDPDFAFQFSHTFFAGSSSKIMSSINAMTRQLIIPFVRDYKAHVLSGGQAQAKLVMPHSKRVFIVHGHDAEARETAARFLGNIGFEPVILHEQANRGRTVIEKVEANSDVGFAIVLLTPDDLGRARDGADLEPRARQNVLLELGYFIAKLGRDRVCALKRGDVVIPSDFAGVVWTDWDTAGAWKTALGKELQAAGYEVDWNMVMR